MHQSCCYDTRMSVAGGGLWAVFDPETGSSTRAGSSADAVSAGSFSAGGSRTVPEPDLTAQFGPGPDPRRSLAPSLSTNASTACTPHCSVDHNLRILGGMNPCGLPQSSLKMVIRRLYPRSTSTWVHRHPVLRSHRRHRPPPRYQSYWSSLVH
jgi:hypothetical protein